MARNNRKKRQIMKWNDKKGSFWGGILIAGLAGLIGIAVVLLKAHRSGEQTPGEELREMILELQDSVTRIAEDAQSRFGEVTDQFTNGASEIQSRTAAAAQEAEKAAKEAQKGARKTHKHVRKAVQELA